MPCLKNSDGMGSRSVCSDEAEFYIACILWGKNAGRGKKDGSAAAERTGTVRSAKQHFVG